MLDLRNIYYNEINFIFILNYLRNFYNIFKENLILFYASHLKLHPSICFNIRKCSGICLYACIYFILFLWLHIFWVCLSPSAWKTNNNKKCHSNCNRHKQCKSISQQFILSMHIPVHVSFHFTWVFFPSFVVVVWFLCFIIFHFIACMENCYLCRPSCGHTNAYITITQEPSSAHGKAQNVDECKKENK